MHFHIGVMYYAIIKGAMYLIILHEKALLPYKLSVKSKKLLFLPYLIISAYHRSGVGYASLHLFDKKNNTGL